MAGTLSQPYIFLAFVLAGGTAGLLYALFWLLRHFVKEYGFLEAVFDFTFLLLFCAIFFLAVLTVGNGQVKAYYFLAAGTGFGLCLSLLNRLFHAGTKLVITLWKKERKGD